MTADLVVLILVRFSTRELWFGYVKPLGYIKDYRRAHPILFHITFDIMGPSPTTESTLQVLLAHTITTAKPQVSPAWAFAVSVRPYLELIRLEKVREHSFLASSYFDACSQPTGTILMFWPFGESSL